MSLFWNKWVPLRTEGGSRADLIDQLEAYFKSHGLKAKITAEGSSLKRIHVLKKDANRARELLVVFDHEH